MSLTFSRTSPSSYVVSKRYSLPTRKTWFGAIATRNSRPILAMTSANMRDEP
ncbi:Uncharacterised protein [uncultured archaeon]|nr:Uncharacterised protein [uncultured archaeon]